MKSGYILIDCSGVDLTKGSTEQTISGLYARVKAAYNSGKMMIAENAVWGDQGLVSPIQVFAVDFGTYYVITASTLQIWLTNADKVTIVNMVGD